MLHRLPDSPRQPPPAGKPQGGRDDPGTRGRRRRGLGTIQLAAAAGARVDLHRCSEKVETCRELGAEVSADYREENFAEAVKEATNGRGADVILDL